MTDLPAQGTRAWEYKLVHMGNPLEAGVEERANAFGQHGWELAAIDAGVWVFKRPAREEALEAESARALIEVSVPLVEAPSTYATAEATPAPRLSP
jgi:hypothetical protein